MAVPTIIPIEYVPDHHTDAIGHWEGGQFLGSVVAAFPEDLRFGIGGLAPVQPEGVVRRQAHVIGDRNDLVGDHVALR